MDDLEYEKVWFPLTALEQTKKIKNIQLLEVVEAYNENIIRVHRVIGFIPRLIGIAVRHQLAACMANQEHAKRVILTDEDKQNKALIEQIDADRRKIISDTERDDLRDPERMGEFMASSAENMMAIVHRYGYKASPELESLLFYMLMSTWTAFEVMAADLWEVAININPRHLSGLHGGRKTSGDKEREKTSKLIELDLLHTYLYKENFNLSNVMGTIHRKTGRFKFTTLDGIRGAYSAAFHNDAEGVIAFTSNQSADALAQIRHILVHKAGRADEDFVRAAKSIPGLKKWKSLKDRDRVEITGDDVRSLVLPVIETGVGLICAVDDWLSNHSRFI